MRIFSVCLLLAITIQLSAKKAPKWTSGNFKTTASGLQYKIVKEGKGDPIGSDDGVLAHMYSYSSQAPHVRYKEDREQKKQVTIVDMSDENILPVIKESVCLLKKGGKGFFILPPRPGDKNNMDTLYCFIRVIDVIHKRHDVFSVDSTKTPNDSVSFVINDPQKKYFGDTLFSLMKLVETPQIVSCGGVKVIMGFKFETTTFDTIVHHKTIVVFIECPDFYGQGYFVAGENYMVTCVPFYDDLKNGSRTMNSYSLEKLDRYYGLRVTRMKKPN